MATFIRGLTDAVPQATQWQPDFTMLQKALQTQQGRYDQGFAAVNNTYNQVANAPLSDSKNIQARQSYIQDANQKLKDLSSVDLSLPENQQAANNVFAPFWQDQMILKDASYTKSYQDEMQKMQGWRDSTDPKIRDQFNPEAYRYLENGAAQLQKGNRDPNNYNKWERRQATPFENVQTYLDDEAKKEGLKIIRTSNQGPYLQTIEGGVQAIKPFSIWASNKLNDPRFNEQFRIQGTVSKEDAIKNVQTQFPGMSDDDALKHVGAQITKSYSDGLNSNIDALTKDQDKIKLTLDGLQKIADSAGGLPEAQQMYALQMMQRRDEVKNQLNDYTQKKTDFENSGRATQMDQFLSNPDYFLGQNAKQQTVDSWANARASGVIEDKWTLDPVYAEANKIAYQQAQLNLAGQGLGIKEERVGDQLTIAEMRANMKPGAKGTKTGTGTGKDATLDANGNPIPVLDLGKDGGLDTANPVNAGTALQNFQVAKEQKRALAYNMILGGNNSVGAYALGSIGVSQPDIVRYLAAMRKLAADPTAKVFNDGSTDAADGSTMSLAKFRAIGQKIYAETDINASTGYQNAFAGVLKLADLKAHHTNNAVNGEPATGFSQEDLAAASLTSDASKTLAEYNDMDRQQKTLIAAQLKGNPDKYKTILNPDGSLVTADDVVKTLNSYVPQKSLYPQHDAIDMNGDARDQNKIALYQNNLLWGTKKVKEMSYEDYAKAFVNGDANYNMGAFRPKGDWRLHMPSLQVNPSVTIAGQSYYLDPRDMDKVTAVSDRYGNSEDHVAMKNSLNTAIVPSLPQYQNATGKMGRIINYDISDRNGKVNPTILGMVNELGNPGNRGDIMIDGTKSLDEDKNKEIVNLIQQGGDTLNNYVSAVTLHTLGKNGNPVLDLTFKPDNKKEVELSGNSAELASLLKGGKKVSIEINPKASGSVLGNLQLNPGNYVHGDMLQGKTLAPDKFQSSYGFDFEAVPNDPQHPTSVTVTINERSYNPDSKTWGPLAPVTQVVDLSKNNPDQIVELRDALFNQHMQSNKMTQDASNKAEVAAHKVSMADLEKINAQNAALSSSAQ